MSSGGASFEAADVVPGCDGHLPGRKIMALANGDGSPGGCCTIVSLPIGVPHCGRSIVDGIGASLESLVLAIPQADAASYDRLGLFSGLFSRSTSCRQASTTTRCRYGTTTCSERRGPESNRRIAVLQTAALPLGYRAERAS